MKVLSYEAAKAAQTAKLEDYFDTYYNDIVNIWRTSSEIRNKRELSEPEKASYRILCYLLERIDEEMPPSTKKDMLRSNILSACEYYKIISSMPLETSIERDIRLIKDYEGNDKNE
ncbi:MAG: hypothetical protein J7K26_02995 [Candidatus Aenigmarchaeota archaeon]|nr:hypothetical protein [Candidatus Aenigmarchaeota archaeon]